MSFFQHVDNEAAILIQGGVEKQCDLYTRDGYLYAKVAGGYVRLFQDGSTMKPKMRLVHMSWTGPLSRDRQGRLCTAQMPGAIPVDIPKAQLLLGVA